MRLIDEQTANEAVRKVLRKYGFADESTLSDEVWDTIENEVPTAYELAEYEKLEEQGLLLKLPCKAGDVVFRVSFNTIYQDVIVEFSVDTTGQYAKTSTGNYYRLDKFGKTVFLTREEAENLLVH